MFRGYLVKVVLSMALCTASLFNTVNALTLSTSDLPPFSMRLPNGEIGGPFIEVVRDVCAEMNEECKFELLPNKRLKYVVRNGETDAGFPYGWNEERAKYLYYSIPFLQTEYGLFVSGSNNRSISSPADLQNLTIGVFGPQTNMYHRLNEIKEDMVEGGVPPFSIHASKDIDGALVNMLKRGRIDGYYVNKAVGYFRASRFNVENIKYVWKHMEIHYFVVFPKATTDIEFVRRFNQAALKVISQQGYLEKKLLPLNISPPPLNEKIYLKYDVVR